MTQNKTAKTTVAVARWWCLIHLETAYGSGDPQNCAAGQVLRTTVPCQLVVAEVTVTYEVEKHDTEQDGGPAGLP